MGGDITSFMVDWISPVPGTSAIVSGVSPATPQQQRQAERSDKVIPTVLGQMQAKENAQRAAILSGTTAPDSLGRGKLYGAKPTGGSFLFRNSPAATNFPGATDNRAAVLGAKET